jgi:hypothetical protein
LNKNSAAVRPISSKTTFLYKRVFPVIWFGGLLLFIVFGLFLASRGNQYSIMPFVIVPLLMAIFGYWIMRKLTFDLVDEVLDAGDTLVVRSGGQEDRIALRDIKNVNYSPYMSPPRVTLSVRRSTLFGQTVTFCAPVSIVPFSSSPIIQELVERVDSARQNK